MSVKCKCGFDFAVFDNSKGIRHLRRIVKNVQIKDKRRKVWECSVICPKCKEPVEFTL